MKKYLIGLVLVISSCAFGQSLEKCQTGACYGFGAPVGAAANGFIYQDVSQAPPALYCPKNGAWVQCGGGGTALPSGVTVDAEWPFNDGSGTTITDITGNGHDATFGSGANAPTWANYGVNFSTAGNSPIDFATTNITSFKSIIIAHCVYPGIQTTGTPPANNPYSGGPTLFGSSSNDGILLSSGGVGGDYSGAYRPTVVGINPFTNFTQAVMGVGQCQTTALTLGANDALYTNGVPLTLSLSGSAAAKVLSAGGYEFGAGYYGYGEFYRGTITYALLSIATVWTPVQVQQLNAYIQAKLAMRTMPIYPTFSQSLANQLIFPGDSIWSGRGGSAAWTSLLTLNNTYTVSNWGLSGMAAWDISRLAESRWYSQVAPFAARNVIVSDGGSNDVCAFQYTAATAWASIVLEATKAKAVSAVPVASTIISRTGCDASIAPLNVMIRTGWRQAGFAALLDLAELPPFAAGGYSNLTYYQADGIHPAGGAVCTNADGYGLLCLETSRIVNTLDGSTSTTPDTTASNAFVATDANNYVIQTPTAAATYTLVSCGAITGQVKTVVNGSSSFAITVGPTSPDTIVGSAVIAAGGSRTFTAVNSSPTASGCYWVAK